MSNKVKDISIKHHIYYFFVDTINLKKFHRNNIKMKKKKKKDGNSYKNILLYCIGYVYIKVNSVNALYLIINKVKGYFQEIYKSKYLTLVSTNESKGKIKKY